MLVDIRSGYEFNYRLPWPFLPAIASFQPKKKGSYVIEVAQEGKPISGSPFKIEIGENQLCHANKVKVSGANREATANKWNDVAINLADAGRYRAQFFKLYV